MMPFFQHRKKKKRTWYSIQILIYQTIFAPLQVRIRWYKTEKRALSWISPGWKGSLTLEAALSLPLFLFACVCLMMPMKIMGRQRQIQAAAEAVGEELSKYAYLSDCMERGKAETVDAERERLEEEEDFGSRAESALTAGYAALGIMSRINGEWVEQVSFAGTEIGPDEMVHIVMSYRLRLPFSVLGLDSIPMETICSRRMWTGADGNRLRKGAGEEEEEEEIVYIGKSSSRFHRNRSCHYLDNDLKQVPAEEIEGLRNQEGKRYQSCKACGSGGAEGSVYVMPYGTSYHTSGSCSAIIAYVQAVPLSQVEHLGPCSYCGGD